MVASAGYLAGSCLCTEQPVLRPSDRPSEDIASVQNGGSRAPYPGSAVTVRDVSRGTAMCRLERPR